MMILAHKENSAMRTSIVLLVAGVAGAAALAGMVGTAEADSLAPKKPSDLVVLTSVGGGPPCLGGGTRADVQVLPDGSTQPFAIPHGQVLIVTGLSLRVSAGADLPTLKTARFLLSYEGGPVILEDELLIGPGVEGTQVVSVIARTISIPMVAVKSGAALCVTTLLQQDPSPVRVYGFLAKDR